MTDNRNAIAGARQMLADLDKTPIRVKPLEWQGTGDTYAEAVTIVGVYLVQSASPGAWAVFKGRQRLRHRHGWLNFATKADAKAVAQADYEKLILSVIDGDHQADKTDE